MLDEATRFHAAYIFDLDGTIYLGDELLPGAARLVGELRARDIPVRFLSNNPTRDPEQYAQKLTRLGLPTASTDIVNTVVTTVNWLVTHHPKAAVFPIAEPPLIKALSTAGIRISEDPAEIDIVIASYDRAFDYRKLQIAFDAIWFHRRAFLIQTNPDRFCPFPEGRGEPDCAAIVAAIEACTQTKCQATLGKPDPLMMDAALSGLSVERRNCLMVGDRLVTDIELAHRSGVASALVLTGDSTEADLAGQPVNRRPTYVLSRIDHLLPSEIRAEAIPRRPPSERPIP